MIKRQILYLTNLKFFSRQKIQNHYLNIRHQLVIKSQKTRYHRTKKYQGCLVMATLSRVW